ncbi:protein kinase [Chloroflexi bacterium TSY]|nr:protein kinase [Chloroflexi bacterium TSY]
MGVPPEEETTQLFEAIRTRRFSASKGGVSDAKNRTDAAYENPSALPTLERYVVGELLATGGHGEVYRGRDTETNTPVVIKRLKPDVVQRHPEFVERFQREGEVLRQLDHPNIVKILAVFEHKGQHNIVMEYISGGSLRDLLKQESPLALEQALLISLELADALSRSHHQGIIHRDLKPANVLLTMDGAPRLTDFGIAYLVRDEVRLTQSGALLGSPAYASPEVLNDEEPDARSDIWSFGVLLYEMLAGRPPFVGKTITAIITGIMSKPIPPIVELRADTPPALVDLFRGMLTKERTQRIASMRQVAAELEAIRDGKATPFSRTPLTPSPPPVQQPATPTSAPLLARPFAPVDQQVNHATSADESVREMPSFTPVEPQVFVARQQGMDRLDAQLDSALAGQMQIVFVTGEAGQGKTALLQAFARQAQVKHPQLIVVSGNCNAYTGSGDPYLPFREILELLTGNMEARLRSGSLPRRQADQLGQIAPHTVQALVEHGPDLFNALIKAQPLLKRISTQHLTQPDLVAELQRIASREQLGTSGVQQIALFEQVGKVLQRVALRAPLVLMLEDLHWIDAGQPNYCSIWASV